VRSIIASSQMLISIMWTTATTTFEQVEATFRIEGRAPELWYADTGQIEPAAYHIGNGRTAVPLHLDPYETVFVVFRKPAASPSRTPPQRTETAASLSWN
jgi:hypothetical protein